jgi:hypothetical protein
MQNSIFFSKFVMLHHIPALDGNRFLQPVQKVFLMIKKFNTPPPRLPPKIQVLTCEKFFFNF